MTRWGRTIGFNGAAVVADLAIAESFAAAAEPYRSAI